MLVIKNKNDLKETIELIDIAYSKLTSCYYEHHNISLMNFNKLTLEKAANSTKFLVEAINYMKFMSSNFLSDYMLPIISNDIRARVKTVNSLREKMSQYISNPKVRGKVIVNKSINDLVGVRFLVDGLNNNLDEYLSFLKELKKDYCTDIYRPYIKNKSTSDYCAIHIYLKKENYNKYFSWEIQLWDSDCKAIENNKREHSKHENNRNEY